MDKPCTCHQDDNPPVPCQKKYALTECRAAAYQHAADELERLQRDLDASECIVNGMVDNEIVPLKQEVERLQRENAELRAQLPEGMEHCTIVFKECEKGHGRLTATNWVQHECQTCEIERLRAGVDRYREREAHNTARQWIADDAARKEPK